MHQVAIEMKIMFAKEGEAFINGTLLATDLLSTNCLLPVLSQQPVRLY